jgi:hypothetical protein
MQITDAKESSRIAVPVRVMHLAREHVRENGLDMGPLVDPPSCCVHTCHGIQQQTAHPVLQLIRESCQYHVAGEESSPRTRTSTPRLSTLPSKRWQHCTIRGHGDIPPHRDILCQPEDDPVPRASIARESRSTFRGAPSPATVCEGESCCPTYRAGSRHCAKRLRPPELRPIELETLSH